MQGEEGTYNFLLLKRGLIILDRKVFELNTGFMLYRDDYMILTATS